MVGWILKNYNYVNSSQNFDFLENCVRVFVCICIFSLMIYKYYTRCTCVCPLILADTGLETGSWGGRPSWWWGDWSRKALRNTYKMDEYWKTLTMWILLRILISWKMFDPWRRRRMEKEREGKQGPGKHLVCICRGKQNQSRKRREIFWNKTDIETLRMLSRSLFDC